CRVRHSTPCARVNRRQRARRASQGHARMAPRRSSKWVRVDTSSAIRSRGSSFAAEFDSIQSRWDPLAHMGACRHVALFAAIATLAAVAQEPPLPDLMRRVHEYVTTYEDHVLSGMVAQETYHQQVFRRDGSVKEERRLVSEYVILQLPPDEAWYGFRNVIEVDGQPQPGR